MTHKILNIGGAILCLLFFHPAAYAQMKIHPDGSVEIHSQTPAWGRAVYTVVKDELACAYHLCKDYAGNDMFYVCAQGWTWNKHNIYIGSDSSFKYNILPIESPLQTIASLTGRQYFYKDVADKQPHFGFVAQEVEQTHPELVKTMHDGTKALAYNEFIAILLEGIKAQQAQIEGLQKEVAGLKKEVKSLKKQ